MKKIEMISTLLLLLLSSNGLANLSTGNEYYCLQGINSYLSFDLTQTISRDKSGGLKLRISNENPISLALTKDTFFLKNQFKEKIENLTIEHQNACLDLANQIYKELFIYFENRLRVLLARHLLQNFYKEAGNLLAFSIDKENWTAGVQSPAPRAPNAFSVTVSKFQPEYLSQIYRSLIQSLKGTKWQYYSDVPFVLTSWSMEWANLLRRQAPAAVFVTKETAQIALRPMEYPPKELELFLFHEISHIVQPSGTPFFNELYAWQKTAEYLDFLQSKNIVLPSLFQSIQTGIHLLGLEKWVQAVISAEK